MLGSGATSKAKVVAWSEQHDLAIVEMSKSITAAPLELLEFRPLSAGAAESPPPSAEL